MSAPLTLSGSGELRSLVAGFTSFDWLLCGILLWSTVRGLLHGLIRELFAMAAVVAGVLVAAWNYERAAVRLAPWLAGWLATPASLEAFAFLLLAAGTALGILLLGRLLRSAARLAGLGLLDRLSGALFGLLRAVLVEAALLIGLTSFLPPMAPVQNSRLAPYLLHVVHAASFSLPAELQQRFSLGMLRPRS